MSDLKAVEVPEGVTSATGPQTDRTRWAGTLPYLAAVLVTAYVCSPMASGRYFGDVGDARWTVSLHEHWYRVWHGEEGIRNLLSYDPLPATLGTSDAFFVQGQVYSLGRLLGAGLPEAWAITQATVFLIGALGVATLSRFLIKYTAIRCAFVLLVCASYPVIFSIGHVQLIGFLSTSWITLGYFELSRRHRLLRGWLVLCLVPPLMALSSWYAIVLFFVVAAFVIGFQLLFASKAGMLRGGRNLLVDIATLLQRPWAVVGAVLGAALWASVAWIYLPAKQLLPPPQWQHSTVFAPRFSDILNASGQGGGIWGQVYARFFSHFVIDYEQARGFTPVLFVCFMALGLFHLRRAVLSHRARETAGRWPESRQLAALWLAVLAVIAFVIVDERGLGIYRFAFTHIPGMDSIRAPFRIQALTYAIAILVSLRSAELLMDRISGPSRSRKLSRRAAMLISAAFIVVVFVEMQRPIPANWTPQQFLSTALMEQIPQAQRGCDATVLTGGANVLMNAIDGVDFAALSGLPTPQGYGRADPLGHPGLSSTPIQLATWMRDQGFEGRICQVTPSAVQVIPAS
jgi:hypothetical protein